MNAPIIRLLDGPHQTNALQALPPLFEWPLPERLMVARPRAMEGVLAVMPKPDDTAELPRGPEGEFLHWTEYTKVRESGLTDEQAAKMAMVVRGAEYSVNPEAHDA